MLSFLTNNAQGHQHCQQFGRNYNFLEKKTMSHCHPKIQNCELKLFKCHICCFQLYLSVQFIAIVFF